MGSILTTVASSHAEDFQIPIFTLLWQTSFCSGNQSTCPRREKAKARLELMVEEVEVAEVVEEEEEHHELVRGEKLDSWRCLSCSRLFWHKQILSYVKHILSYVKVLELLEGAENGRYKVIAKAEPYKNLPVRINIQSLCPKKGARGTKKWLGGCWPKKLFVLHYIFCDHAYF